MSDRCAICELDFLHGEGRLLRLDGSKVHEIHQPESMARCREALRAKVEGLRAAKEWSEQYNDAIDELEEIETLREECAADARPCVFPPEPRREPK